MLVLPNNVRINALISNEKFLGQSDSYGGRLQLEILHIKVESNFILTRQISRNNLKERRRKKRLYWKTDFVLLSFQVFDLYKK